MNEVASHNKKILLHSLKQGIGIIFWCIFLMLHTTAVRASSLSENDAFLVEQEWMHNPPKEYQTLQTEGKYSGNSRIIFFGDSCTHGYPDTRVDDTYIYSYAQILPKLTGCEYTNYAWYGASLAGETGHCFHTQLMAAANWEYYDIAIVQFGINDYCMHIPLGDLNSTDYNTICGALNNNIQIIRDNGVEPIVILPYFYYGQFLPDEVNWQNLRFNRYVEAIRNWCNANDVAIIDFNTKFDVTLENFDQIYMDRIHPGQDLQKQAAQVVYDYILKYGDGNSDVSEFVDRMYRVCLQREADDSGKKNWERKLLTNQVTGINLAYGFVFSDEMTNRNLSDADFIDVLYNTLLGRNADAAGKEDWEKHLQVGMSRKAIFVGFANSEEYKNICASYGIVLGDTDFITNYQAAADKNYGVTAFISRLYTKALQRPYDADGLNHWCGVYASKQLSMLDIATTMFFTSPEFLNKKLSDEDFLTVLYQTFFDRRPDANGMAYWKQKMNFGMDRNSVVGAFGASEEFSNLMKQYGI